jgi:hypothetical protein
MVIAILELKIHFYLTQREDPVCVWEDDTEEDVGPKKSDTKKNWKVLQKGGIMICTCSCDIIKRV